MVFISTAKVRQSTEDRTRFRPLLKSEVFITRNLSHRKPTKSWFLEFLARRFTEFQQKNTFLFSLICFILGTRNWRQRLYRRRIDKCWTRRERGCRKSLGHSTPLSLSLSYTNTDRRPRVRNATSISNSLYDIGFIKKYHTRNLLL